MKLKAPSVTSLRVKKLSANYMELTWDDVGSNFYYFVDLYENGQWRNYSRIKENSAFISNLEESTKYKVRIQVSVEGFDPSDYVETEELETFELNAYNITKMRQLELSDSFISKRLQQDDKSYLNFATDQMMASLMSADFTFLRQYSTVDQVRNYIIKDDSYHEIQGSIEPVCVDTSRVMIAQFKNVLYAFERFQPVIKVSNDKGQTWKYYKAFNDRVGNPVSRTVAYQNSTTSYVLGYTKLFYGRQSNDVRWSSDQVRFSDNEVTFAKVGEDTGLDFPIEIFSEFATLPGDVSKYAEAIAATDERCYIASRGTLRYIDLRNTPIETDPGSPVFGEKIFNEERLKITDSDKVVIKKMDVVNNQLFVLIAGEVKEYGLDPTKPENVINSKYKGVYKLEGSEFTRIYGNTVKEREYITQYSNMSTNGYDLFLGISNFNFNSELTAIDQLADGLVGEVRHSLYGKITSDENVLLKDLAEVSTFTSGGEYSPGDVLGKTTSKHIHYAMVSTNELSNFETWNFSTQEYYNEFNFSYFHRDKTRTWINTEDYAVVVYPETVYTKMIDEFGPTSPSRVLTEKWNNGHGLYISPNIEFSGFNKYTGGILIHSYNGDIFGYFEFDYRARDYVKLVWKPNETVIEVDLIHQIREEKWKPKKPNNRIDPDLTPLLHTMGPDSYLDSESGFYEFGKTYLEFISSGTNTEYNKLLNLVRNKYPLEQDSTEFLWSEINRRNIYLDKAKKESVVRFFESRKSDFYSKKGTEASYKFLFKLLYNEDVEIDIESKNSLEYDIVVKSDNISEDIVGTTINTSTGKANVTYIEREYQDGKLIWRVTIHNLLGRFIEGQEVTNNTFKGTITVGVRGKDLMSNTIDYIDRSKSSYMMRIKSKLPSTRYRDDVLRFVHPAGFGFIGVTLITMLVNSGLNMKHSETIIRMLNNLKFDMGYPNKYPDKVLDMDHNGDQTFDPITGEVLYLDHPKAGEDFIAPPEYDLEEDKFYGMLPSDNKRRSDRSPLFDCSGTTFSNYIDIIDKYLKDNLGNPRDPEEPTQEKL